MPPEVEQESVALEESESLGFEMAIDRIGMAEAMGRGPTILSFCEVSANVLPQTTV